MRCSLWELPVECDADDETTLQRGGFFLIAPHGIAEQDTFKKSRTQYIL